mmetsp:Transcript_60409/g.112152  ORF Transcript_60409/g.112152 Transcript_60409/m.112152 type:complete len:837 (-) Transcript_60409:49-2559(-)
MPQPSRGKGKAPSKESSDNVNSKEQPSIAVEEQRQTEVVAQTSPAEQSRSKAGADAKKAEHVDATSSSWSHNLSHKHLLFHAKCKLTDDQLKSLGLHKQETHQLKEIDLSQNCLTSVGARSILDLCCRCPSLRILKLFKNQIDDGAVNSLVSVLHACKSLLEMHLSHNKLTETGIRLLVQGAAKARAGSSCTLWLRVESNSVMDEPALLSDLMNRYWVCPRRHNCTANKCGSGCLLHMSFLDPKVGSYFAHKPVRAKSHEREMTKTPVAAPSKSRALSQSAREVTTRKTWKPVATASVWDTPSCHQCPPSKDADSLGSAWPTLDEWTKPGADPWAASRKLPKVSLEPQAEPEPKASPPQHSKQESVVQDAAADQWAQPGADPWAASRQFPKGNQQADGEPRASQASCHTPGCNQEAVEPKAVDEWTKPGADPWAAARQELKAQDAPGEQPKPNAVKPSSWAALFRKDMSQPDSWGVSRQEQQQESKAAQDAWAAPGQAQDPWAAARHERSVKEESCVPSRQDTSSKVDSWASSRQPPCCKEDSGSSSHQEPSGEKDAWAASRQDPEATPQPHARQETVVPEAKVQHQAQTNRWDRASRTVEASSSLAQQAERSEQPPVPRVRSREPSSRVAHTVAALPGSAVDPEGRTYNLDVCVVNFASVGATYARTVLRNKEVDFDWEGVRRCVQHLIEDVGVKVVGCIFENFVGPDNGKRGAGVACTGVPSDIAGVCESIQATPRLDSDNHRSVHAEQTIKCAYRRNCRFLDNDNYKQWLQGLDSVRIRGWLQKSQDLLHIGYYFDSELGTFDTLGGNLNALRADAPEAQHKPPASRGSIHAV